MFCLFLFNLVLLRCTSMAAPSCWEATLEQVRFSSIYLVTVYKSPDDNTASIDFFICQDLASFSSVTWSLSRSNTGGCPHISLLHQDYGTKNISTNYSIILICKTLRVGPLGFMCVPDDEIPGNAGLLDQVKHFHHQFCHCHHFCRFSSQFFMQNYSCWL